MLVQVLFYLSLSPTKSMGELFKFLQHYRDKGWLQDHEFVIKNRQEKNKDTC